MTWVFWIFGGLMALGVGLAIFERRRGRDVLKHDLSQEARPQTEADRWAIRADGEMAGRAAAGTPMDH